MKEIKTIIQIDNTLKTPIYKQIIDSVKSGIESKLLKKGDLLPSINEICDEYNLAKGTVVTAYNSLRASGIISSTHGKGFYVSKSNVDIDFNIFMIFDQINPFKQIIYDSFVNELGVPSSSVTIFYHHYNFKLFENLINENIGNFNYYVIMPHIKEDVSKVVKKLPKDRTLIIDNEVKSLSDHYPTICQAFEKDIFDSLVKALDKIKKYQSITFILSKKSFQFIPEDNIIGFNKFCDQYNIKYSFENDLKPDLVQKGKCFIIYNDNDLIELIKTCRSKQLELGKDIGLISYDDTPMKEILEGGISVISTDFALLGKNAALMIKNKTKGRIENPGSLILRKSL
ncbi:MAG: GntR family transcriptional regulator [Bacteroidota bacterium]|nr:GntR family transcriptional regulator [Bacteroidota bacterium]